MPKKRATPEDDVNRLAERIWQRGRGKITTIEDFNAVYDSYMTSQGQSLTAEQKGLLKKKVYKRVVTKHHLDVRHGKNKQRQALFARAGLKPSPAEFSILGRARKRTVYLRRTHYTTKRGKYVTAYRDQKGRFGRPLSDAERKSTESTVSVTSRGVTYDPTTGKYS